MKTQKVYFWQKWSYQALQQLSAQNDSNLVHCSLGKIDSYGILGNLLHQLPGEKFVHT